MESGFLGLWVYVEGGLEFREHVCFASTRLN